MYFYRYLRRKARAVSRYFWSDKKQNPQVDEVSEELFVEESEEETNDLPPEEAPKKDFPWRKAFELVKDYFFNSDEKLVAWLLLSVIIICVVAMVALTFTFSWWWSGFYALLMAKAAIGPILISLGYFALQITAMVGAYVLKNYLLDQLTLRWRDWLTNKLVKQLFTSKNNYLDLHRFSKKIENLAQRIQEDVKNFVSLTLNLGADFLKSVLSFGTFVGILWVVGGALTFVLFGLNIVIPGYLVWVALIVAVVATVITYFIGRSLAETNKNQEKAEAEFRDELSTLTDEAENIAVERAENYHQTLLEEKLKYIKENTNERVKTETKLNAFQNIYSNIAQILPILASIPLFFLGLIDFGSMMQVGMAFGEVNGALSWFANTYQDISQYQTAIERITEMQEALEEDGLDANPKNILRREKDNKDRVNNKDTIKLKHLDVMLPQADSTRLIMRDLNLKFKKGEDVLLRGGNGTGKSTIFKVIRGTWQYGEGQVTVPKGERMCFLPQTPSIPPNVSLKGLLAYPKQAGDYEPEQYAEAFNAIKDAGGMDEFISELQTGKRKDWQSLSGGQKQLISIARAILKNPTRLFLDEATAAMDDESEAIAYRALKEKLPEATIVSIAHKHDVQKYHSKTIYFARNKDKETEV
ncbi:MAG: ABC transporter ATP-binding protein/permease, partial [Tatlockia sp.]|nr:ABC transporter ATP-binding protein/permease [Tatlockia sp.]